MIMTMSDKSSVRVLPANYMGPKVQSIQLFDEMTGVHHVTLRKGSLRQILQSTNSSKPGFPSHSFDFSNGEMAVVPRVALCSCHRSPDTEPSHPLQSLDILRVNNLTDAEAERMVYQRSTVVLPKAAINIIRKNIPHLRIRTPQHVYPSVSRESTRSSTQKSYLLYIYIPAKYT